MFSGSQDLDQVDLEIEVDSTNENFNEETILAQVNEFSLVKQSLIEEATLELNLTKQFSHSEPSTSKEDKKHELKIQKYNNEIQELNQIKKQLEK